MSMAADPLLQALTSSAVDATAATTGWLLSLEGDVLRVVAAGGEEPGKLLGTSVPAVSGTAGFVVASGQPLALSSLGGDARLSEGMAAVVGHPFENVLCVPCGTDEVVAGALELVDKQGAASFSFDDVELATLLAGIAGVALAKRGRMSHVPSPAEIAGDLERLAATDPARYATIASLVSVLLVNV
jgi:GAF domain-containing protein